MAFAIADRVREQASFAGGTGAITLTATPVSGFQSFLSGWGASGTGWYCISIGAQWETGLGTLNAGGTTLTRTTVYSGSSGAGVAVNFSSGVVDCTGVIPASRISQTDAGTFGTLKSKIIPVSRAMTAATGSVSYTGAGFKPTCLILSGAIIGTAAQTSGMVDSSLGSGGIALIGAANLNQGSISFLIYIPDGTAANYQNGVVTSLDADGFTVSWTKGGSPTGTATYSVLCLK